jgi:hypothetical protein
MATRDKAPKQTRQTGDGRKDERKGTEVGKDIADQGTLGSAQGNAQGTRGDSKGRDRRGQGGQNSEGGQWGLNKGKGGQDSHNKR